MLGSSWRSHQLGPAHGEAITLTEFSSAIGQLWTALVISDAAPQFRAVVDEVIGITDVLAYDVRPPRQPARRELVFLVMLDTACDCS